MQEENQLCKVCNTHPVHGYVQGSGEYLRDTCLVCHRKRGKIGTNYIEGGDSKGRSKTHSAGNRDDR